jgi:glucose/arabinose dehydrogenase
VYVAHSYQGDGGIRNRVVRMRWENRTLGAPRVVIDGIAGAGNHNGTRLAFGPDGMLYVTTGDAGRAERAQNRDDLSGKILRLTPDGRPAPGNPWNTAVWSMGHRNPQGLVFRPGTDELFATEHGPGAADELNRIRRGGNYGWPSVHGACDTDGERAFCAEHDVVEPIAEYTPTIGISGLDFYDVDLITGWRGSLVYTSLRGALLLRTNPATGETERLLEGEYGRLRDVLVAPTGAVYVATSNRDGRGRPASDDDRILRITP